jgi:integral membrane protein (TIGR00529 family)
LIVIVLILLFSKYELSVVLLGGALLFGFLADVNLINSIFAVCLDPAIILIALALVFIPLLGGLMEKSGLMEELIENMNISKRTSLMLAPALYGLLPVAGGALMSAPIIDQIGSEMENHKKVAINVWFRHIFILIYPVSLLVISEIADINLYVIMFSMLIPFVILAVIGYGLLVRMVSEGEKDHKRDYKKIVRNVSPILLPPLVDLLGRTIFQIEYPEFFLLLGLIISLFLSLKLGNMNIRSLSSIGKQMKLWRFPLLIISMFLFLEVFQRSSVPTTIASLNLPFILFLCLSFFLGFATGRIQLPLSIMVPIYISQYVFGFIPLLDFSFLYLAIFLGYLITPIHPCVSYSIEYYDTTFKKVLKQLSIPTFLSFGILIIFYIILSPL